MQENYPENQCKIIIKMLCDALEYWVNTVKYDAPDPFNDNAVVVNPWPADRISSLLQTARNYADSKRE
jgi:hypothetical protein